MRTLLWSFALLLAGSVTAMAAGPAFSTDLDALLRSADYLYVATRRADGTLSKKVPVWFMYDGDAAYFTTAPGSYKAKRIRRGSPLHVWVGTADGPSFTAAAELLDDPAVAERMAPAYNRKYWIAWLGFFRPRADRVRSGKTLIVRVRPAS
jgi:PPOX class probable F420-dependent enzyme